MKPHIWWGTIRRRWLCVVKTAAPPLGVGDTPQEAYADWKRKTDSLSRIDADQTQA